MKLTLGEIRNKTGTVSTYNKGIDYAEKGKVSGLKVEELESGKYNVTANVSGSSTYQVSGKITENGAVKNFRCTCRAFQEYAGLCKHCVAVLYKAYYVNSEKSTPVVMYDKLASCKQSSDSDEESFYILDMSHRIPQMIKSSKAQTLLKVDSQLSDKRREQQDVRNSPAVGKMLNLYSQTAVFEAVRQTSQIKEKVRLEPKISYSRYDNSVDIELFIGNKRMYVLRDLSEFVGNFATSKEVSYGKFLTFAHTIENFEEESKPLLRLIIEKVKELKEISDSYYLYGNTFKRQMKLYPATFDRFFKMYENRNLDISIYGTTVNLLLIGENPKIDIDVHKNEDLSIQLRSSEFEMILGEMYIYFLAQDKLYRCDKKMTDAVRAFLSGLAQDRYKIRITKDSLPLFCSEVLPIIQGYINFTGDTDVFSEYAPIPLEIEMFFDMPSPDVASCSVSFNYGSQKIEPNLSSSDDIYGNKVTVAHDIKQELIFKAMAERYFENIQQNNMWTDTEEGIYNLLEDGLSEFSEIAKIEVTDRFRKQRITPSPRVCVGVALDGGLLELTMDTDGFSIDELAGALKAYREKRRYYRLKDGEFLRLSDGALGGVSQIADGLNLSGKELANGKISIPAYRSLYLDRVLRANENIRFDRNSAFKNLVRNIKSVEDSDFEVPKSLADTLRNYQKTGFRWLKTMESYHFCGILADDMGLGKTIQVIALILSSFEQGIEKPSLIVCPSSLVYNWESEFHKFAPMLTVRTIAGTTARRHDDIAELKPMEIAVTSYDLLKRDIEQYQNVTFQYEIIDEAQYIKNHNTQNAKAVKAVKSVQRFALTGTPIENRLSELWSIFDFLMPGYCFTYNKFRQRFEIPIVRDKDETAREQFGRMVAPFLLRRLKQDVLSELPPKDETVLRTALTGEQKKLYAANQSMLKEELQEKLSETAGQQGKLKILALLTRLRQICCDPSLCYDEYKGGSAKLEMCMELISEAVDGGHKVLLFSQFTSMLKILSDRLDGQGIPYYVLQGSTSKTQRMTLVEQFNADTTPIFLISLKAGGTGLNLTGADIVIHYDPWWNIAAQNQATDRAHRIGQKNSVHVYKLVAQDTIEERILNLQETKMELADSVVSSTGESSIMSMSTEDIRSLLD